MKTLKTFLSQKTSFVTLHSLWTAIPAATSESIRGGATGDGPYCDPDKGYVLPEWYIIGNEGGNEGEYSGKQSW
jgi:hypothetical protein